MLNVFITLVCSSSFQWLAHLLKDFYLGKVIIKDIKQNNSFYFSNAYIFTIIKIFMHEILQFHIY